MNYKIKPFEDLEFSDDFIFCKIMHNPEICAGVIERLLHIKVDHIEYPELQKNIQPYYTSKGVRFDVYLKDSSRIFDIEMQTYNDCSIGKRMRYYQSIIDMDNLMKGDDYSELKESYIIFICKDSPFENKSKPVFTFKSTCQEDHSVLLDDKTLKAVYNASAYENTNDKELKAFLNYVCSSKAEDNFTERISRLVAQAKALEANKTEYVRMNLHDRDIIWHTKQEALKEGKELGALQKAVETAKKLLTRNFPLDEICDLTDLPKEKVLQLQ